MLQVLRPTALLLLLITPLSLLRAQVVQPDSSLLFYKVIVDGKEKPLTDRQGNSCTCRSSSMDYCCALFDTVQSGSIVTFRYLFRNTGKDTLIIANLTSSCGCVVPEYDKTPIPPGASREIRARFNSLAKTGMQEKTLTMTYYAGRQGVQYNYVLHLKGYVRKS